MNQPSTKTPNTPMYRLIAGLLGRDPVEFIRERRGGDSPVPFAKIADEITAKTGEYVTHELPRRWLNFADEAQKDQAAA